MYTLCWLAVRSCSIACEHPSADDQAESSEHTAMPRFLISVDPMVAASNVYYYLDGSEYFD